MSDRQFETLLIPDEENHSPKQNFESIEFNFPVKSKETQFKRKAEVPAAVRKRAESLAAIGRAYGNNISKQNVLIKQNAQSLQEFREPWHSSSRTESREYGDYYSWQMMLSHLEANRYNIIASKGIQHFVNEYMKKLYRCQIFERGHNVRRFAACRLQLLNKANAPVENKNLSVSGINTIELIKKYKKDKRLVADELMLPVGKQSSSSGAKEDSTSSMRSGTLRKNSSSMESGMLRKSSSSMRNGAPRNSSASTRSGTLRKSSSSMRSGTLRTSNSSIRSGTLRKSGSSMRSRTLRKSNSSMRSGTLRKSNSSIQKEDVKQKTNSDPLNVVENSSNATDKGKELKSLKSDSSTSESVLVSKNSYSEPLETTKMDISTQAESTENFNSFNKEKHENSFKAMHPNLLEQSSSMVEKYII